jgi:hypothetical protein
MALQAHNDIAAGLDSMTCLYERKDEGDPSDMEDLQAVQKALYAAKPIVDMVSAGLCKEEGRTWPHGSIKGENDA